jgi:LysR family transcriptional regulator, benzoate and cis,cis-muconate-responsive activator of ben and cat genes
MDPKNPLEINILIVVIAQEGNFIRASKKLGVTPPSLTRKVSTLERSIGVKLFDRSTRTVQLTTAGRLFVQESSIAMIHAERAWNLARFQAQIETGPYRIGYSPYTHSAFLPLLNGLIPVRTTADIPSGIVLETANTFELVERVLRGQLHAAPVTQTEVTYTYKVSGIASWAQRPDIQAQFADIRATISGISKTDELAGLQLTNQGWEVPTP